MAYHILIDGEKKGPFGTNELSALMKCGYLTRATKVWSPELEEWVQAGTVAALGPLFAGYVPASPSIRRMPIIQTVGSGVAALTRQPIAILIAIVITTTFWIVGSLPMLAQMAPILAAVEIRGVVPDIGVGTGISIGGSMIAGIVMAGGICAVLLDAVRGRPLGIARLATGIHRIIPLFTLSLIFAVILMLYMGIVFALIYATGKSWFGILLLPTALLALVWYAAMFFVVDEHAGALEAFGNGISLFNDVGWWRIIAVYLLVGSIWIGIALGMGIVTTVLGKVGINFSPDILSGGDIFAASTGAWFSYFTQLIVNMVSIFVSLAVLAVIYENGNGQLETRRLSSIMS